MKPFLIYCVSSTGLKNNNSNAHIIELPENLVKSVLDVKANAPVKPKPTVWILIFETFPRVSPFPFSHSMACANRFRLNEWQLSCHIQIERTQKYKCYESVFHLFNILLFHGLLYYSRPRELAIPPACHGFAPYLFPFPFPLYVFV